MPTLATVGTLASTFCFYLVSSLLLTLLFDCFPGVWIVFDVLLALGTACSKGVKKVPPIDCSPVKPKKSKDGFYRARSGGGALPPCALDRIGKEEIRYGERVTSVEFSPNGRIIAGGFKDGMARLWDLKTGREIQTICKANCFGNAHASRSNPRKTQHGTTT